MAKRGPRNPIAAALADDRYRPRVRPGRRRPLPDAEPEGDGRHQFRLYRGPDDTPEIEAAKTRLEAATARLTRATNEAEQAAAIAEHDAAQRQLGQHLLARDKQRRPHIYAAGGDRPGDDGE